MSRNTHIRSNACRALAVIGDAESPAAWSGIPHFLLRAAKPAGFASHGLNLTVRGLGWKRFLWQSGQGIRFLRPRGYQYSLSFASELLKITEREVERLGITEIISHFQLLQVPVQRLSTTRISFYIDCTLKALVNTQRMDSWLDEKTISEAFQREQENYRGAFRVVSMSRWIRDSLVKDYSLDPAKVLRVLPGANLPEDVVCQRLEVRERLGSPEIYPRKRSLRLGFTGKDWKRKGLGRLVDAAECLEKRGVTTEVLVIGHLPAKYRRHPNVRWAGFVDKANEVDRFIDLLLSCDFGCSPSYEEPLGIAPLEYLRLGIPVLCTDVGGLKDVCEAAGPAAILVPRVATGEELAGVLAEIVRNDGAVANMRDAAWTRRNYFSWNRTVAELEAAWAS